MQKHTGLTVNMSMVKEIHHTIIQHREQGAGCREAEAECAGYSVIENNNTPVRETEK